MLALSRRPNQRILFPSLNIAVEILKIQGNSVRLGIEAPSEIAVLREEIAPQRGDSDGWARFRKVPAMTHDQRNQLNTAVLALHVVEKQMHQGLVEDAQATLQYALQILESLDAGVAAANLSGDKERPAMGIKALLVEDDPVEESLLTRFLQLSGFQVEHARDGYEALEHLQSHPRPDFVLLDMRLPRLNGQATISAIRKNPRFAGLRVFAVTGSSPAEVGVATGPEGVDQWFQKPINPGRLVEAMNSAVSLN